MWRRHLCRQLGKVTAQAQGMHHQARARKFDRSRRLAVHFCSPTAHAEPTSAGPEPCCWG